MIEVTNLVKHYGDKKAVNDISFFIPEGEVVGFLGPNGAGKSTTMNIITGYLSATSGSAKIGGVDILEDPIEAKRHIGYLPEHPPLYMDMTVKEYLDFIYNLKGCKGSAAERAKHIGGVCEVVGADNVYKRVIKNLSKGYKQRVGLAQALIGDPEVLILDEPTVGLDPIQIIEIRNVIKDLGKRRTVILSSHILPEVQQICGRVLVINKGLLIADDSPDNLAAKAITSHRYNVRVLGNPETALAVLRAVEGVASVSPQGEKESGTNDFIVESKPGVDVRVAVYRDLEHAGIPPLQVAPVGATLEDIFLSLTGHKVREEAGGRPEKKKKSKKAAVSDERKGE